MLLAHPGVANLLARRAVVGPGICRGVEGLLGRLEAAGFPGEVAVRAIYTVLIYTLGFTIWEAARPGANPDGAYATQWREGFARLAPGQFAHVEAVLGQLGTLASEAQYEFGLRALVRGPSDSSMWTNAEIQWPAPVRHGAGQPAAIVAAGVQLTLPLPHY